MEVSAQLFLFFDREDTPVSVESSLEYFLYDRTIICRSVRAAYMEFLEFDEETQVELAACQVVRYGVLLLVGIRHPVVRIDVGHVEQIEEVSPYVGPFYSH